MQQQQNSSNTVLITNNNNHLEAASKPIISRVAPKIVLSGCSPPPPSSSPQPVVVDLQDENSSSSSSQTNRRKVEEVIELGEEQDNHPGPAPIAAAVVAPGPILTTTTVQHHNSEEVVEDMDSTNSPIKLLEYSNGGGGGSSSGEDSMDVEPQQQQQMAMVESDQTALLNIASMTDFGVEGLGDQHINGSNGSGMYQCQPCHKTFPSSKMLQSHNQAFHLDKSFVCEICGKAFRFRSNLAEHRSVHTAVKPFVCKFCGKSSRLKGNLTKHILKHHKVEQKDYIGTDDIIIKKGKKSVKDPAAIDFLERSMIVLDSEGMLPLQQDSATKEGGGSMALLQHNTQQIGAEECFLMSLGLDAGSIDLKGGDSIGDEEEEGGSMADELEGGSASGRASATSNSTGHQQQPQSLNHHNLTDQLLEKCNSAALKMEVGEHADDGDNNNHLSDYIATGGQLSPNTLNHLADQLSAVSNSTPNNTQLAAGSAALAAAACKALLFGNNNTKVDSKQLGSSPATIAQTTPTNFIVRKTIGNSSGDGGESGSAGPMIYTLPPSNGAPGGKMNSSKCPECGKQLRKARDLIAHLAAMHNIAPPKSAISSQDNLTLNNKNHLHSSSNGGDLAHLPGAAAAMTATASELHQMRVMMGELKVNTHNSRVEQMVSNLDGRVGRLEKQLEMALNSIYTLVQLQTGINQQVTRFRDETSEGLRSVLSLLSEGN